MAVSTNDFLMVGRIGGWKWRKEVNRAKVFVFGMRILIN
jgi:hypothetical protein